MKKKTLPTARYLWKRFLWTLELRSFGFLPPSRPFLLLLAGDSNFFFFNAIVMNQFLCLQEILMPCPKRGQQRKISFADPQSGPQSPPPEWLPHKRPRAVPTALKLRPHPSECFSHTHNPSAPFHLCSQRCKYPPAKSKSVHLKIQHHLLLLVIKAAADTNSKEAWMTTLLQISVVLLRAGIWKSAAQFKRPGWKRQRTRPGGSWTVKQQIFRMASHPLTSALCAQVQIKSCHVNLLNSVWRKILLTLTTWKTKLELGGNCQHICLVRNELKTCVNLAKYFTKQSASCGGNETEG